MKPFLLLLLICLPAAFALCLLPAFASAQFYHPDGRLYRTPAQYGLDYDEVGFASGDDTRLHGWFLQARGEAKGTVIHFHGNAQNMSAHFSFVHWLPAAGFNLFVFDYRGYGESGGKPDRKGVHADGVAALEYVRSRDDVDPDRLLVLGQSIGGAVAVRALADVEREGIRGVAVESTFDSYQAIARDKAPDLLAALLIRDRLSPDDVVAGLSPIPLLVIHGNADRVVPYARGKALYDRAQEPKQLWTIDGGRHTEAFTRFGEVYRKRLVAFFEACLER